MSDVRAYLCIDPEGSFGTSLKVRVDVPAFTSTRVVAKQLVEYDSIPTLHYLVDEVVYQITKQIGHSLHEQVELLGQSLKNQPVQKIDSLLEFEAKYMPTSSVQEELIALTSKSANHPNYSGKTGNDVLDAIHKLLPGIEGMITSCPHSPMGVCPDRALSRQIIHLNDDHKWTREKIADWLDTLDFDLTIGPKPEKIEQPYFTGDINKIFK